MLSWHERNLENIAVRFFHNEEVSLGCLWLLALGLKATEASSKCGWMAAQ